ncbi:hypothetical protein CH333_00860 [candidate division WOR-3 bacterium JGI_Cruoil_03_44_89]|uniref:Methyltransferase domain-containing protein n=1 Tax=candidate division WOR-3 bacterium JGI_Cruoil_03_44_89 TaxID=1973748 RepID=A0A235BYN4_UNCW3|nr:MAG: hypothetical protein CH333_00860 [candidate division WOR-3 bacterium JGI_Cruoil_03_44_89]
MIYRQTQRTFISYPVDCNTGGYYTDKLSAGWVIGIDTSLAGLFFGRERLRGISNCLLLKMDAIQLAFRSEVFDRVICIQNGISAFHVNHRDLIREDIPVAKPGGTVLGLFRSERDLLLRKIVRVNFSLDFF